jgi:hypothetical protein
VKINDPSLYGPPRCKTHAVDIEPRCQCPLCPKCPLPNGPCLVCQEGGACPGLRAAERDSKQVETDRWWLIYYAVYSNLLGTPITSDARSTPFESAAKTCADAADTAIAEAKKRGRL